MIREVSQPLDLAEIAREESSILTMMVEKGHLAQGEELPEPTKHAIALGAADGMRKLQVWIDEARTGTNFPEEGLLRAAQWRLKNMQGITMRGAHIGNADLSGFSFADATMTDSVFTKCNLAGVSFDSTELFGTNFLGCDLESTDLSHIRMRGVQIDLIADVQTLFGTRMWDTGLAKHRIPTCPQAEAFYRKIFDTKLRVGVYEESGTDVSHAPYSRRGIVLMQEGKPVGILKIHEERSFLPLRTLKSADGETIFRKGMLSALHPDLVALLAERAIAKGGSDSWYKADVESIANLAARSGKTDWLTRAPRRFIHKPDMYDTMQTMAARLEGGKEPLVDILPEESVDVQLQRDNKER